MLKSFRSFEAKGKDCYKPCSFVYMRLCGEPKLCGGQRFDLRCDGMESNRRMNMVRCLATWLLG